MTSRYIITTPEFMIKAGREPEAWGRMSLTYPLGWVEPQFAHTFDSREEAINLLYTMGFGIGAPYWVKEV